MIIIIIIMVDGSRVINGAETNNVQKDEDNEYGQYKINILTNMQLLLNYRYCSRFNN